MGAKINPKIACNDRSSFIMPNNESTNATRVINTIKIAPTLNAISSPSLVPLVIASIELL